MYSETHIFYTETIINFDSFLISVKRSFSLALRTGAQKEREWEKNGSGERQRGSAAKVEAL